MTYEVDTGKHRIIVVTEDKDGNEERTDFCEEIRVTSVIVDLLTEEQSVEVKVWVATGAHTFTIPADRLDRDILPVLLKHGVNVVDTRDAVELLLQVLLDSKASAPVRFVHRQLGFAQLNGELVFLVQHPVSCSDAARSNSNYTRSDTVLPAGSVESYRKVLREEALGHPALELALCIGVVPLVTYILREAGVINDLPIFALIGPSSTGKTTALRLIASLFGSPREREGLIGDFNATEKALYARFANMCGLPLILDESTGVNIDFGQFALRISKGFDRERCSSDGAVKPAVGFCGAFILTGERSPFSDRYGETGASARVVELTLPWTENAAHAMRLEEKLAQNHGTAVVPLVEALLKNRETLSKFYSSDLREVRGLGFSEGAVEARRAKMYALVLNAATLVNLALGIKVDRKGLLQLMIEQHRQHQPEPEERDSVARLYDAIQSFAAQNNARIIGYTELKNFPNPNSIVGKFAKKQGRQCVWIVKREIDAIFARNGFLNPSEALKKLAERGWVFRSNDRHYAFPQQLGKARPRCYCVFL